MSSIRERRVGKVRAELSAKTINKHMFREAVKSLLEEKALDETRDPVCFLEIQYLDCLTKMAKVEEAIEHNCPEVTNVQMSITSVN